MVDYSSGSLFRPVQFDFSSGLRFVQEQDRIALEQDKLQLARRQQEFDENNQQAINDLRERAADQEDQRIDLAKQAAARDQARLGLEKLGFFADTGFKFASRVTELFDRGWTHSIDLAKIELGQRQADIAERKVTVEERGLDLAEAAQQRETFFFTLMAEATSCKTMEELHGPVITETYTDPWSGEPKTKRGRPGGFAGYIRGMYQHDRDLAREWSIGGEDSAFDRQRTEFIKKLREEGKDEETVRKSTFAWFDRVAGATKAEYKYGKLIHEGNVTRIIVKDEHKKILLDIPVTIGVAGFIIAPWLAALGVIAAMVTNCTIVVIRKK